MNPRQLAEQVKAKFSAEELCEAVEIAGAGFLNFRLKKAAIETALQSAARGEHLFFQKTETPRTIVVDFSSPNVAKPMHVGHIRSTILGDSLARIFRLLGHCVITDNHIGDWGTQFGMLLYGWKNDVDQDALKVDAISELERVYRKIQSEIKSQTQAALHKRFPQEIARLRESGLTDEDKICDKVIADLGPNRPLDLSPVDQASRAELVKLQGGDGENLSIWREMIALSEKQFRCVYQRLNIKFDYTYGESFYNPWLKEVVRELQAKNIAHDSGGAIAVFSDGSVPQKEDPFLIQRDGKWEDNPAMVQKTDGGFNYTTTDLATLKYRLETWQPNEIVYVTDGRQQLHFNQIFATFRRWHPEAKMKLAHVWFGSILGEDGKPFKTRSGDTIKLEDLLDEAEERAFKAVSEKNPALAESERKEIARVVGLGSIKYADLSQNRQSDIVFNWDKMLSLQGNTAPYLQYAYTRVRSIFRKAEETSNIEHRTSNIELNAPEEIALAKHLLNFGLVLEAAADDYRPNYLCSFLYELSGHFARFYENCPVLKAEGAQRGARLALCDLTARVLKQGLEVLGIETTEQM